MIIRRIRASNFQRYKELDVSAIPARGIVAVVGPNESGKSTIGEAVTFGLFGRTLRSDHDRIAEVINWRDDGASVTITFSTGESEEYEVVRELDRAGSNFAQLTDLKKGEVLGRGVGKVQQLLDGILGFTFDEFRYSFYLGQKEFDALLADVGGNRREMVDGMTGVAEIERALAGLEQRQGDLASERDLARRELSLTERLAEEYKGVSGATDPCQQRLEQAREKLATLEKELAGADLERTRAGEAVATHRRVTAALEALKVRIYAGVFQRVGEGVRKLSGKLAQAAASLDQEVSAISSKLEAHRAFRARLDELAALVKARTDELGGLLKNNLEGVYSTATADEITPDGKREQLVIIEKRIEETAVRTAAARSAKNFVLVASIIAVASAFLMFYLVRDRDLGVVLWWATYLAGGVAGLVLAGYRHSEAGALEQKRQKLETNRQILEGEVSTFRRSLEACASFDPKDPSGMAERVRQMRTPRIQELFERIQSAHSEFLTPEGVGAALGDQLARQLGARSGELADTRRQQQEVDEFQVWLSTALASLADSSAFSTLSGDEHSVTPDWSYQAFREQKSGVMQAVTEATRRLSSLESLVRFDSGEDVLEILRKGVASLQPRGGGPKSDWWTEVARLSSPSWDGSVEALSARLRSLAHELVEVLPTLDDLQQRERSAATRMDQISAALGEARVARESASVEIRRLEPDVRRGQELSAQRQELSARIASLDRKVRVHERLKEILVELADQLNARCGPGIAEFLAYVLPQLTGGRYDSVRLTPDFCIEIYSREKGDFVGLESLSGGTVDQLLLALRLAFSKALVLSKRSATYAQYLFFDEPFSSFDEERADSFVQYLRRPDPNFVQIFLVSHLPGLARHCDLVITTRLDQERLIVGQERA